MRIIVTGGRHYRDRARVFRVLDEIHAATPITFLGEGGATGADAFAKEWAIARGVPRDTLYALWTFYGPVAGSMRNERMLVKFAPIDLVLAFPGEDGTADMVRRTRAARVAVRIETP